MIKLASLEITGGKGRRDIETAGRQLWGWR
jgi:hypothetical protein